MPATIYRPEEPSAQPETVQGRDIVIVSLQPWYYEIGSNCKNIATHFAKHNRVLYVNVPMNRRTYHSKDRNSGLQEHYEIIRYRKDGLKRIGDNMWQLYPSSVIESINWIPNTSVFKIVNHFNNRRFAKDIRKALQRLGFIDFILFNDNEIYNGYGLKELLNPSQYIYYCRDFLQGYDYWKRHCQVLEPELIAKADSVTANSLFYADYCSGFNRRSFYIGQGCDFSLFDPAKQRAIPEELKEFEGLLIGYVGAIDSARLDEQIIRQIAEANPSWKVILVGPEDEFFINSALHDLPNIKFLGRKPLAELADYVNAFDVCINPQLINIITKGNYPLKIDEYLAMGKPVVATRTKTMELFEEHVYLADRPEDYPILIRKALAEDHHELRQIRMAFARTHTWENCMKELYKVIMSAPVREGAM